MISDVTRMAISFAAALADSTGAAASPSLIRRARSDRKPPTASTSVCERPMRARTVGSSISV